ncbi:MAG: hypothetical protein U0L42_07645 [Methanobrevibacter sp.]|uniref:hypothetical protein n=1 Tax=Methanobrevibacter sp. TaxID=66852 RepID=UPI002E75CDCF|nr:hypothetical protein [Methanobrevibacter sp.]MEE0935529.1 hypothetical protein [Methanobrevibacter sp.]
MVRMCFDIDKRLFGELKKQASKNELNLDDLIEKYVRKGLDKENLENTMLNVSLNDNVVEKVNIMSKLTDRTPEEVVNDTLWENLRKIEDVPDDVDYEKIWNMLEHDNPDGDDILDNLIRLGKEGWD